MYKKNYKIKSKVTWAKYKTRPFRTKSSGSEHNGFDTVSKQKLSVFLVLLRLFGWFDVFDSLYCGLIMLHCCSSVMSLRLRQLTLHHFTLIVLCCYWNFTNEDYANIIFMYDQAKGSLARWAYQERVILIEEYLKECFTIRIVAFATLETCNALSPKRTRSDTQLLTRSVWDKHWQIRL